MFVSASFSERFAGCAEGAAHSTTARSVDHQMRGMDAWDPSEAAASKRRKMRRLRFARAVSLFAPLRGAGCQATGETKRRSSSRQSPARSSRIASGYSLCSSTRIRSRERLRGVGGQHRHGGLQDDRAGVEIGGDEMNGGAADLRAVVDGLPLRVDARKRGQERRVDVDHAVGKRREETRAQETHETREADERDVVLGERLRKRAIVGVARRPLFVRHHRRLDPGRARALEPVRVRRVGDDDGDRRVAATRRRWRR